MIFEEEGINSRIRFFFLISLLLQSIFLSPGQKTIIPNPQALSAFDRFFEFRGTVELSQKKDIIGTIREILVDNEENIWILDSKKCQIKKFTKKGDLIATMGGKGAGPFEFIRPFGMDMFKRQLFVTDPMSLRLQVFDLNANTYKKFIRVEEGRGIKLVDYENKDFIILTAPITSKQDPKEMSCVHIYDIKGDWQCSFFPVNDNSKNNKLICDGVYLCLDKDNKIYAVQEMDYRVFKYTMKGGLLKIFSRNNDYYKPSTVLSQGDRGLKSKLEKWIYSWTHVTGIKISSNFLFIQLSDFFPDQSENLILDVYDLDGNFITGGLRSNKRLLYIDRQGIFYFLDEKINSVDFDVTYYIMRYSVNTRNFPLSKEVGAGARKK